MLNIRAECIIYMDRTHHVVPGEIFGGKNLNTLLGRLGQNLNKYTNFDDALTSFDHSISKIGSN